VHARRTNLAIAEQLSDTDKNEDDLRVDGFVAVLTSFRPFSSLLLWI
jgi:hypothetical protein